MKFLVTGATGFIGRHLVHRLLEQHHEVVVLSRNIQHAQATLPPSVTIHYWNPIGEEPPKEAFEGVEAVLHLAGENIAAKRWSAKQKDNIINSRVLGTRHLVEKINSLKDKPKVLVSTSASGIYADRKNEELTEDSQTPEVDFLSKTCLAWEAEAKKVKPAVRLCLIRVGIALGKDGGAIKKMITPFKMGVGGRLSSGQQWMSWIHIDDLVNLYIACAENETAKGVFHGTAPNPVTNQVFTYTLGRVLKRPTIFPVPAFALKTLFGDMATILLSSAKCLPVRTKESGFNFEFVDLESALRDLLN